MTDENKKLHPAFEGMKDSLQSEQETPPPSRKQGGEPEATPSDDLRSEDTKPTPKPATPAATPETPAAESDESDEPIRDPDAYARSQEAKKYRLKLREAEEQIDKLTTRLDSMSQQQAEAFSGELEQLKAQLAETQQQAAEAEQRAEAERVQRLRTEAIATAGLDPEFLEFVTATDAEGIETQVAKLAEKVSSAGRGRLGGGTGQPPRSRAQQAMDQMKKGRNPNAWDIFKPE